MKAIQRDHRSPISADGETKHRSESDCILRYSQSRNLMSEITRVYQLSGITAAALIAVSAVIAIVGTALGI